MSARLTVEQRRLRALTEGQWQAQVCQLAEAHGYSWVHLRAARTKHGWRVPVEGPLGKGWPDLTLVGRGRRIYAELKRELGKTTPEQEAVHQWIRENGGEVYVWRPSDLDEVIDVLRGDAQ